MSIRNLDFLFDPRSVAVIGASDRPDSIGGIVWRNLRAGGFEGSVHAVNRRAQQLDGEPVVASVDQLAQPPELAVICTPPPTVPGLVAQLAAAGTRAAIVVGAGMDARQRQAMLDAARPALLRVLGPDSIGLLSPHIGLNASFAPVDARPGDVAFVSQSGALVTAVLDWARGRGIGFSHFVSLGQHADVDFGDMLDWLASDERTRSILLYIESIEAAPRKFMSAARSAARNKPVIVVKAGRSARGGRAAALHTGALAGADRVFDAAIARAGMLRVDTLQDLFMAAETLARFRGNRGEQLAVLANGGGAGVMAADAAPPAEVELCTLGASTLARLDALLPAAWPRDNPVDILGDAPAERYAQAVQVLLDEPAAGAVLVIHAPTALVSSAAVARALVPLAPRRPPRLMACWLGDAAAAEGRQVLRAAGIPTYATPEEAVRAFAMGVRYRRNQELLMQAPPAAPPGPPVHTARARERIRQALADGQALLTEPQAKAVLEDCGIPVVPTRTVGADPDAAAEQAREIGFPVALKIVSPDITHKTDVGGVALNLGNAAQVRRAAAAMLARVAFECPEARLHGFSVQAMVRRAQALELIVGASIDPVFGPVLLFGQGGTAVEVTADRAVALPPLNETLARALVSRTRVARLLDGWGDTPPVDRDALYRVLIAVSRLLTDVPEIAELDINPLVVDASGAVALDASLRASVDAPAGAARFAIRPYPAELCETVDWQGRTLTVRPIRPEDEARHLAFLSRLEPEDVRMRIFYSRRSIPRSELARLTQIDYAREMAFIALHADDSGEEHTLGVVRAVADPDNIAAEFGIVVRSDLKGARLGELLLRRMIAYLRANGTQRLVATVLYENRRMRELARGLGFTETPSHPPDGTVTLALAL